MNTPSNPATTPPLSRALRFWRWAMAVAIVLAAASALYEFVTPGTRATLGLPSRVQLPGALHWQIRKVDPTSPAGKAGIVKGDTVYLLSPYAAYRRGSPVVGVPLQFRVEHGGATRDVTLVPVHAASSGKQPWIDTITPLLKLFTQYLMFLVATLLIWQRPDLRYARALAMFLVAFGFNLAYNPFAHFTGNALIAAHFFNNWTLVFSLVQVLIFATAFPLEDRGSLDRYGIRRFIARSAYPFGLLMVLVNAGEVAPEYAALWYIPIFGTLWWVMWSYALVATIVALGVALSRAQGSDRQRLLYITITFLIGFIGPILTAVAGMLHLDYEQFVRLRLTSLVIPFGFGYAILRHRVLDLGYAVSRAIVFGVFLTLIVPFLAVIEYVTENAIAGNNAEIEIAVKSVLLVCVGFGLPYLLRRFDELVDSTFFRERRQAKMALNGFAHQLQFVSELEILMRLTIETIDKHVQPSGSAIYLRSDDGRHYAARASSFKHAIPAVGENDLAVLQLRAQALPVDLTAVSTTLIEVGTEAFPMMVRGSLSGFIVVGRKTRRENYTPDELAALASLASATGGAIDVRVANSERERAQAQVVEQQRHALEELQVYNKAYARFVPQQFLERLGRESIVDVDLGDQVQGRMTIMFTDIRGFTTLSEKMSPAETFAFLNSYLSRVGPVIRQHRGLIDKYLGDGLMALFPDRADDAVQGALDVLREVRRFNRARTRENQSTIRVGLGIHSGHLMLGTIGEHERMDTTVISDAVNLASRMEGVTKYLGTTLVVSSDTVELLEDPEEYHLRPLGTLAVVGKSDGIGTYEVFDADEPALLLHKTVTLERFIEAIETYQAGRFAEALPIFEEIAAGNPEDGPARFFRDRSRSRLTGTEVWDGVERLLAK